MTVVTTLTLADLLDEAGLTGRGGGAFPTGAKLRAARASHAELIVNACDGEPGSLKDAWVVREHLAELVHGAELLAGGAPVRFAAHQGSATLAGLQAGGVPTLEVPARYVSSQESALVSLAAGGLARPMTARVPIVLGGRDGAGRPVTPTLVVNAETAWRVAQVSERGPAWFRSHGTPDEPGPRLVTLTGHLPRPGVLDTAAGIALADLLAAGGLERDHDRPVLVGGLAGGLLAPGEAQQARWSTAGLAPFGARIGAGTIEALDPRTCPLEQVAARVHHAAGESAGQCGPCMFGLPALARDIDAALTHPGPSQLEALHDRLGLLPGRGACRFPDGVAALVRSALRAYGGHLVAHGAGRCPW